MAVLHAIDGLVKVLAYGFSIGLFGLGNSLAQQGQGWIHHGQIDEVTVEHTVVQAAIRIGQQLGCSHVHRHQRGLHRRAWV